MKKGVLVLMIGAMAVSLGACATSSNPTGATGSELTKSRAAAQPSKPGIVAVDVTAWTATVQSIDYAKKIVVLEREGKVATVDASYAKRLNEVKPGDLVRVAHIEETAIYIRKADSGPMAGEMRTVELAPKGKGPGGIVTNARQFAADVEEIDYEKRTITLRGPDGAVKRFKVSEAVERFNEIRQGDQVVLAVTDAIAIAVEKP